MTANPDKPAELYIIVDVETSGPSPSQHALLSLGACTLAEPSQTFYIELQPDRAAFEPEALAVNRLSLDALQANGVPPQQAMQQFAEWVAAVTPAGSRPVFTAFNAPYDWMFVNDYFHRYLGKNPFGHNALDIKAYFMGLHGTTWSDASHRYLSQHYGFTIRLPHHALQDAQIEARIFRQMLAETQEKLAKESER